MILRASFLLFFFIFLLTNAVSGQKVYRAVEALSKKDFDKAENLFGDLLRKDSNDLAGLIGYAKTMKEYTDQSNYKENIEIAHGLLLRARSAYSSYSQSDLLFVKNSFQVESLSALINMHMQLVDRIWEYSFRYSYSISEINRFIKVFSPFSSRSKDFYVKKLITLTYDSLMKAPTILSLNQFKSNYPQNEYIQQVDKKIEILRYEDAVQSSDPAFIENFIKDYPRNVKLELILERLAYTKYTLLHSSSSRSEYANFLSRFQDSPYNKNPSIRGKLDTVYRLIEGLDFRALSETAPLNELNTFLQSYPRGEYAPTVLGWVAKQEYAEIRREGAFYRLKEFMIKHPGTIEFSDTVITQMFVEARNFLLNNLLSDFFNGVLSSEDLAGSGSEVLSTMLQKAYASRVQIDSACLIYVFKNFDISLSDNESLYRFLSTNCFLRNFEPIKILKKEASNTNGGDDEDIPGFLQISVNGKIQSYLYTKYSTGGIEVKLLNNKPNTTAKLYELIKERYKIRQFSEPRITSFQENGVVTTLYGWSSSSNNSAPIWRLEILYKVREGNFYPERALSIQQDNWGSVEEIDLTNWTEYPFNKI